jgi:hypothetical protein
MKYTTKQAERKATKQAKQVKNEKQARQNLTFALLATKN